LDAVPENCEDLGFELRLCVANEVGLRHYHWNAARACYCWMCTQALRQMLIGRVRGLLGRAFPGGASTGFLLGHGSVETSLVELDALVTCSILHEIKRHAKGIVKFECFLS